MCGVIWNEISASNNGLYFYAPSDPLPLSYITLVGQLNDLIRLLGSFPPSTADAACVDLVIRFSCAQAIRVVNVTFFDSLGVPAIPLPSAPCQSLCTDITSSTCASNVIDTLTANNLSYTVNQLLPLCNTIVKSPSPTTPPQILGQPLFPPDGTPQYWNLSGLGPFPAPIPALCAYFPDTFTQDSTTFSCNYPWISTNGDPNGYCSPSCPASSFTTTQIKTTALVSMIIGWVGYVTTILVFFTMMFIPRYRCYPAVLVPLLLVGSNIICFGFIFASIGGYNWLICSNDYTPATSSDGKCVFDALMILFGSLVVTYLWCLIALNSAAVVVFGQEQVMHSRVTQFVSVSLCVFLAGLSCVIALATKSIGYQRGLLFCFIADTTNSEDLYESFSWQYPLFIAPIGICILISSVCIVAVAIKLATLNRDLLAPAEKIIRVGLFLFVFLAIFSFVFAFRFVNTVNANNWTLVYEDWAAAAITTPNPPYPGPAPSIALFNGFSWVIAAQGLILSLLFGSTPDVVCFWCGAKSNDDEPVPPQYSLLAQQASR